VENAAAENPDRESMEVRYAHESSKWQGRLESAKADLLLLLDDAERCPIKYLYVCGRVKSFDSIYAKAMRLQLADPLTTMEDLLGLRIVCLYRSDIEKRLVWGICG
jgi:ppGpp synthetase/RelA/SpoT-type nucleotidyltranferase